MNITEKAKVFATEAHKGQKRKSGGDFIEHPILVASLIKRMGGSDYEEAAGFLHDTVEDTKITIDDIYEGFGHSVTMLVLSNTEDKTKSWIERKVDTHKKIPFLNLEQRRLLLADKYANVLSIEKEIATQGNNTWGLFNAGYESQRWYYKTIAYALYVGLEDLTVNTEFMTVLNEYKKLVEKIFL